MIPIAGLLLFVAIIVSLAGLFFKRWRQQSAIALAVAIPVFVSALLLSPSSSIGKSPNSKNVSASAKDFSR